ncbi:MAG: hydrogenase maturation protease [Gemmatimonadota bacterium]
MVRTLIAGFGNELRGDDALGVEVIHRLEAAGGLGGGVELLEVGTGGIRLAQELLTPCDRLIVVDCISRGGAPGTVYVLEVESVAAVGEVDLHLAVPARALSLAQALGALPARTFLVGCEPEQVDELTTELSPAVRGALEAVIGHVRRLAGPGVSQAADTDG